MSFNEDQWPTSLVLIMSYTEGSSMFVTKQRYLLHIELAILNKHFITFLFTYDVGE